MPTLSSVQKTWEHGLSPGERKTVAEVIASMAGGNFEGMVLEKLKQRNDIFRVRSGTIRVLYREDGGMISILALERRRSGESRASAETESLKI